jgi:bis(5'-nucleosyl)-tetraphosphatase (symmetrical)
MSTYAIGDIQGCYDDLSRLLEKLDFSESRDRLWLTGDLVNRGPQSLEVLRFVKGLGQSAVVVLGNHDLHLIAIANDTSQHDKASPDLQRILDAPDCDELIDWLRHRPLLHDDNTLDFTLVHAGLPPQWDLATARSCAREVEAMLQGGSHSELLMTMYGDKPDRWKPGLQGIRRWRFTINCLTRLRYCSSDGKLALAHKGPPGSQPGNLLPWFAVPGRLSRERRILFGHWSALGRVSWDEENVYGLDTGCLWGGSLTALRLSSGKIRTADLTSLPCQGHRKTSR